MDDADVIQCVLAGDVEAFAVLVDRHRDAVCAVTRHLLPDAGAREDVAQEAFLEAYRALRRYDPGRARFSTWLLTIARRRALNALRRERTRSRGLPVAAPPVRDEDGRDDEQLERLDAALEALPAEQRLAFVLSEVHGLTYGQVALVQEVAVGTVKSRIGRARAALRAVLRTDLEQTP